MGRITEAVKHIIIINVILFIAPQLIQGFDLQSMFALYFPENEKFGFGNLQHTCLCTVDLHIFFLICTVYGLLEHL